MLHGLTGDVGETQTAGVQSVIVGGPDVGAQNDEGGDCQTLSDHNIEDILFACESTADGAEAEHQGVAQEEGDNGGPNSDLTVLGKTDEVGGGGTAGDEGADNIAYAGEQGDLAGRLTENGRKAAALYACGDHGINTEDNDQRNGDISNDLQTLHAGSRGSGHQQAGDDGDNPLIDTEQLGSGDGEHGNAYAEPTDLGEAQQEGGQVGALGTECTTAQQVHGHAGGSADVGQNAAVGGKDNAADDAGPDEAGEIEAVTELCADAHAGAEEGKAYHYEEHVPEAFACRLGYCFQRIVSIDFFDCLCSLGVFRHCEKPPQSCSEAGPLCNRFHLTCSS